MALFDEHATVQTSPKDDDKMEPGLLLEESWFFGNLLDRKSRMLRCYSDPCPSSKSTTHHHQDMLSNRKSLEETFSSLQKLPKGEKLNLDSRRSCNNPRGNQRNLQRAPSLPVYVDYREEEIHDEESDFSMGKLIRQASINNHVKVSPPKQQTLPKPSMSNLQRVPSLPAFVDKEETNDDEENNFSMGKLTRQASLNHARILPPKYTSKGLTKSPSISITTKHHSRRKQEQESNNTSSIEDLQSFKNLDINYEKKDSTPKLANKIKKPGGLSDLEKMRRPPYSSEDLMKEQIKFWARAVASNVK